jgi:hypothetical protein
MADSSTYTHEDKHVQTEAAAPETLTVASTVHTLASH